MTVITCDRERVTFERKIQFETREKSHIIAVSLFLLSFGNKSRWKAKQNWLNKNKQWHDSRNDANWIFFRYLVAYNSNHKYNDFIKKIIRHHVPKEICKTSNEKSTASYFRTHSFH